MTTLDEAARRALTRRGFALECATLGWNVAGIIILAIAAVAARSVALAGFGLDSLIERRPGRRRADGRAAGVPEPGYEPTRSAPANGKACCRSRSGPEASTAR